MIGYGLFQETSWPDTVCSKKLLNTIAIAIAEWKLRNFPLFPRCWLRRRHRRGNSRPFFETPCNFLASGEIAARLRKQYTISLLSRVNVIDPDYSKSLLTARISALGTVETSLSTISLDYSRQSGNLWHVRSSTVRCRRGSIYLVRTKCGSLLRRWRLVSIEHTATIDLPPSFVYTTHFFSINNLTLWTAPKSCLLFFSLFWRSKPLNSCLMENRVKLK